MENDSTNLTAKVWANLANPIKSYDFSKCWLISCMPPSQVTLCDVITAQSLSNGIVHNFHKILLFMKISLLSTFILRYVRAKMIVHAFMIELDQPDYCFENLCTKSMESCSNNFYVCCVLLKLKWLVANSASDDILYTCKVSYRTSN